MRVVLTSEQIAAYSTIEEVNKPVQMRSSAQFRKQQALHPVPVPQLPHFPISFPFWTLKHSLPYLT